ncbi:hypothetical protein LTR36_000359 [Oleoguttula mirabilis]|uniref:Uncharacterized protein n=1 Tax=Oleoguttula mirabilis TaxID=1507867 RepID=A0AAV9JYH6_9PEZI|nr:hypothetical protein LTR36_000359 [Oleoguttula mirabilis]
MSATPETSLECLKALISSPKSAFADADDLDDQVRAIDLSMIDIREGLRHAIATLERTLRRLKTELDRSALETQVNLNALAEEKDGFLRQEWNEMLTQIPLLVEARWEVERTVVFEGAS